MHPVELLVDHAEHTVKLDVEERLQLLSCDDHSRIFDVCIWEAIAWIKTRHFNWKDRECSQRGCTIRAFNPLEPAVYHAIGDNFRLFLQIGTDLAQSISNHVMEVHVYQSGSNGAPLRVTRNMSDLSPGVVIQPSETYPLPNPVAGAVKARLLKSLI
jgi:hypothetical protein